MNSQTVTINGKQYDAHTGMKIDTLDDKTVIHRDNHASQVHATRQKSHTLNRKVVRRMEPVIRRSPAITKFAPTSDAKSKPIEVVKPVTSTKSHPIADKANRRLQHVHSTSAAMSSRAIKQSAIEKALASSPSHQKSLMHQIRLARKSPHMLSIASGIAALVLLGGYFTYINMPNLSVRVAAAQAGINASYPSFHPDGYRLSGPVAYNDGEVSLKFAANAGPQQFNITETRTTWDSTAVQENYVKPNWGSDFASYQEHGLTIYTHGSNAVWVNGGIRYTINGDAPLSGGQIRQMATSM